MSTTYMHPSPLPRPVVRLRGIPKAFASTMAVHVDVEPSAGGHHGLVGEGAEKSTLMRVLAGFYRDYRGKIHFDDLPVRITDPGQARALGIARRPGTQPGSGV